MKRFFTVVYATILAALMCGSVFSALPVDFTPQWTNISLMTSDITFDGNDGNASAYVNAKSGATKVEGTLTVYRQSGSSWVYVDSTSDSTTTRTYLTISVDFTAISGTYYKSVFTVNVTRNGIVESDTMYSYKTCP